MGMNMVYLVTETRMRFGERGINEPNIKLIITMFTFFVLTGLQVYGVVDPSKLDAPPNTTDAATLLLVKHYQDIYDACLEDGGTEEECPTMQDARLTNWSFPLKTVCDTQSRAVRGYGLFISSRWCASASSSSRRRSRPYPAS